MLSVSLPFRDVAEGMNLGSEAFLTELAGRGVQGIELRTVTADRDPRKVLAAAERVWDHGMRISVHTVPRNLRDALGDILAPLSDMMKKNRQEKTVLVMHPVNGEDPVSENRRMMDMLTDGICRRYPGVVLALENNRLMPDKGAGDCAGLVMRSVEDADPGCVGICFDFGHYAWYSKVWESNAPSLPPERFARRVVHTHIHALYPADGGFTTHFPLQTGTLPLKAYIDSFRDSYSGAYNIELEPRRFSGLASGGEGILGSLDVLKTCLNG